MRGALDQESKTLLKLGAHVIVDLVGDRNKWTLYRETDCLGKPPSSLSSDSGLACLTRHNVLGTSVKATLRSEPQESFHLVSRTEFRYVLGLDHFSGKQPVLFWQQSMRSEVELVLMVIKPRGLRHAS